MPKAPIDTRVRNRVRAHLRAEAERRGLKGPNAIARYLGVDRGGVSKLLRGEGSVGLDLVLAIKRKMHVSADRLLDVDPDKRFFFPVPMVNGES